VHVVCNGIERENTVYCLLTTIRLCPLTVGCHGKIRVSCLIVTREIIAINARRDQITVCSVLSVGCAWCIHSTSW